MPNGEPEIEARAADRLIFFSDAVVAIAITLLAIDLPVPTGHPARRAGRRWGRRCTTAPGMATATPKQPTG